MRPVRSPQVSQPIICFAEIIERRGVPLRTARLLRHDGRGAAEWRRGKEPFGHFASYQTGRTSPYNKCCHAFHFIPDQPLDDGSATALFVGATEVGQGWTYDESRLPSMSTEDALQSSSYEAPAGARSYDLWWMSAFEDLVERVVVAWGPSTRSWSQWARRQGKAVIELRRHAQEPPFPGFQEFVTTLEDIPFVWRSWRQVLSSVGGVYLLVHPDGDQYVGSAYGEGGFLARWNDYVANGHGGNRLLERRGRANYTVSVLEVASSATSPAEIVGRESVWKNRLGSRAHGLNAN